MIKNKSHWSYIHSLWQRLLCFGSSQQQSQVCNSCFGWTGAGVSSQHSDAQQPDGGDDSGLHALQARAAAQPAECEWCKK